MRLAQLAWAMGGRLSRRSADALARILGPALSLLPLSPVRAWARTIEAATGHPPTRRERALLLRNWLRNALWSFSLARWGTGEILRTVAIADDDAAKLRTSLAGPGLVLALPHMGSWDGAGTWAAASGMPVVSVAERLPEGLYERFRDARAAMGIAIHPLDRSDLLGALADDVRARRLVCLLSDRDLSGRGVTVPWPGGGRISVPAGPALLARRTGADLRVVTTRFDGPRLRLEVSDPITGSDVAGVLTRVVEVFADAVRRSPENWLMLRRAIR